jgi:chemotaxis protein methyltransferase CheR
MIYFDVEAQKRLVSKFSRSLYPGGYLVLGHAESIQGWNTGLQFMYHNGGTAYKKPGLEA